MKKIPNIILIIIIWYVALSAYSPQTANFLLSTGIILLIPGLLFKAIYKNNTYKNSSKLVDKQYVFNSNTLKNDFCTVRYTEDEKISVMDNIETSRKRDLRSFTITKNDNKNINKFWNRICKIFDGYSTLESLSAFCELYTPVKIILIPTTDRRTEDPKPQKQSIQIDATNIGPKFVAMDEIRPDTYSQGTEKNRESNDKFVNIDNIQKADKVEERKQDEVKIFDLGEALATGPNKIDVNSATAPELAILPGVNIVMAKKIIDFRDKTRLFKSPDDFIEISGIKPHFAEKIKSMIIIGMPQSEKDNNNNGEGRVVDI